MSVQASKPDNCFLYAVQCVQTKGTNGREGESWTHSVEESIISLWLQRQSEVTSEPSFRHVCVLGVFLLSCSSYSSKPESVHSKKKIRKKRGGEKGPEKETSCKHARHTRSVVRRLAAFPQSACKAESAAFCTEAWGHSHNSDQNKARSLLGWIY